MIKIILGTDIKTGEVVPSPDEKVLIKENMSDDPSGSFIIILSEHNEIELFRKIEKFYVTHTKNIFFKFNNTFCMIRNVKAETLKKYKLGDKIEIAIIDKRKKIIAEYEI